MAEKLTVFKEIKSGLWTIWDESRAVHRGYRDSIVLRACVFEVKELDRLKVISAGRRFPHAWVKGRECALPRGRRWVEVTYHPYLRGEFYELKSKRPVSRATYCRLDADGRVFVSV